MVFLCPFVPVLSDLNSFKTILMKEVLYIGLLFLCVLVGFWLGKKLFPKKRLIPKLSHLPPVPCKSKEHDFVPNGYDDFSDYFKCRKCGAEKREHFIKE